MQGITYYSAVALALCAGMWTVLTVADQALKREAIAQQEELSWHK